MPLRRKRPDSLPPRPLIETVQQVADCPCDAHQDAFVDALGRTDELIFRVASANVPMVDGDAHRVSAGDQINLHQVEAQGHTFLLAFPDLDAARRDDPDATYAGIARDEAFRMLLGNADLDGLMVVAATAGEPWAAATRATIERLLNAAPR